MNRIRLVLILALITQAGSASSYADSLFLEANQLYSNQYYSEAVSLYEKLVNQGYGHINLYYNLGNAYYQLSELGNAIWSYEKGLILKPRDDDLRFNLSVANARIIDRVLVPEPFFLIKWYSSLKYMFSPSQWLYIIGSLLIGASAFSTLGKMWNSRFSGLFISFSLSTFFATIIFLLIFSDIYFDLSDYDKGVVVSKEGRVYAAPSDSSNLLFVIHEGTKAIVSSRQYPWVEIQLIDGKKGWLSTQHLRLL